MSKVLHYVGSQAARALFHLRSSTRDSGLTLLQRNADPYSLADSSCDRIWGGVHLA
ncbi:hypothetical protein ZHAS_00007735 [Anopheles sinensis]|uniref:Uncharacterized protein n=1 Tax=Anopheles sinensis TaxID=74873 RepID=A0A084VQL8_ANOSI|nr:hypothetical protein ZHAS_00007735 [Anopheles sinensis]